MKNKEIINLYKTFQIILQNILNPPNFPLATGQIKIPKNLDLVGKTILATQILSPPRRPEPHVISIRKRVFYVIPQIIDILTGVIRDTYYVQLQ